MYILDVPSHVCNISTEKARVRLLYGTSRSLFDDLRTFFRLTPGDEIQIERGGSSDTMEVVYSELGMRTRKDLQ